MHSREFLDRCFSKDQIKHFLSNYDLKVSGRKSELIQRLIDEPEFEIDDIPDMLYHYELQEVCDKLELPRSGNKAELWERIMDEVEPLEIIVTTIEVKSISKNDRKESTKEEQKIPFEAYQGPEPFIFVSYSHEDKDLVYNEIRRLNNDGFNIWYDEGISPASIWVDEIAEAIQNCNIFLVFVSPQAISSQFVKKEINFAITEKKRLFTVYIEKTNLDSGTKLQIGNIQAIKKYKMKDVLYYRKLKKSLDKIMA